MKFLSEPAPPHHLTDWGPWSFVLFIGLALCLWAVAGAANVVVDAHSTGGGYYTRESRSVRVMVAAGAVALVAVLAGVWVQATVARHFAEFSWIWVILSLSTAGGLAWVAFTQENDAPRIYGYGIAAIAGVSVVFNSGIDALSRFASSVPIGLAEAFRLVLLLVIGVVVWAAASRK